MRAVRVGRRRLLQGAGAAAGALAAGAALAPVPADAIPAPAGAAPAWPSGRTASFRWLGAAGWRIDIGARSLLVDPFLTRFSTGLFDGRFDPGTPLRVDPEAIAAHAGTPETILVTHSHWDHLNDVPHIAERSGARVFGTLTSYHLALSLGVPRAQLSPVKGGEVFDFGGYTVEVVASLHSRNASYSVLFPGAHDNPLPAGEPPTTVADLPEGDTLAFQLNIQSGPSVFFMGASDFVERNLRGLRPDVAMVALPSSDATHAYLPRLLAALDRPATVVPVHWDIFEAPLRNPPPVTATDADRLDRFVRTVRAFAPGTTVVVPEYLTAYSF